MMGFEPRPGGWDQPMLAITLHGQAWPAGKDACNLGISQPPYIAVTAVYTAVSFIYSRISCIHSCVYSRVYRPFFWHNHNHPLTPPPPVCVRGLSLTHQGAAPPPLMRKCKSSGGQMLKNARECLRMFVNARERSRMFENAKGCCEWLFRF